MRSRDAHNSEALGALMEVGVVNVQRRSGGARCARGRDLHTLISTAERQQDAPNVGTTFSGGPFRC